MTSPTGFPYEGEGGGEVLFLLFGDSQWREKRKKDVPFSSLSFFEEGKEK